MGKIIHENRLSTIASETKKSLLENTDNLLDQLPAVIDLPSLISESTANYRTRHFTPTVTLNLFMKQLMSTDGSCQQIVMQSSLEKKMLSSQTHSSNTAGYCNARKRLPLKLIRQAASRMGYWLHKRSEESWKWLGRSVKLIDATTVSMPDTPDNQKSFPQSRSQKEGLGFPIARIATIISLESGAILDAEVGHYRTSEHRLFYKLSKTLTPDDILVGDRLYSCYFMVAMLQSLGVDCVFKMNASRQYNFKKGKRLGKNDHITMWHKPKRPNWIPKELYYKIPKMIFVRELEKNKTLLITTLQDKTKYPKNKVLELYIKRWDIELNFRSIKTIMQMDVLRCKSPEMIMKEIWTYFLTYNLIRVIMVESAYLNKIPPRQLSFKAALQGTSTFLALSVYATKKDKGQLYSQLLSNIGRHSVGRRPGRIEPRVVKRRPKPLKLMTQQRHVLRKLLKAAYA